MLAAEREQFEIEKKELHETYDRQQKVIEPKYYMMYIYITCMYVYVYIGSDFYSGKS